MTRGALIGKGMTAEVYEWGEGQALKLYYENIPKDWIQYESEVGTAVHQAGVPAPEVWGQVEVEGRSGLLYERIAGSSLLAMMMRNPDQAEPYGTVLARLHADIHRRRASRLPKQKERLAMFIRQSAAFLGERVQPVLDDLELLPEGESVCHGDLHPDNVLHSDGRLTAIDWMDAHTGDPLCDVARTSMIFLSPFVSMPPLSISPVICHQLNEAYLSEYCRLTGAEKSAIDLWRLPVAAARLREQVPGEQEWLLAYIDRQLKYRK
ncbi:Predicted kinase, aminoglycoside phosphotransferase (APT) family [Paenibacillus catalpae]|uniref:Predicted kinase, aminoglycoside phosphotransferase (APT) family n=1 Tax=Paenibacillus catalpae TaxID=1045775 RepID=A0A1I2GS75_9BACL|nr:phosphotransferase [Paenibacillus catalpae]SFF19940.1 Predicted kinase, aminoglycoside phosphotransferase (APT) family [Paenibacillus catalpae]